MNKLKTMKTVIILATVLMSSLLTTSCGSDDDGGDESSIVGTWLSTSETFEDIVDGVSQGVENSTIDENNFTRITFNADGTFTSFFSESFMQDGELIIESDTDSGTYVVNDENSAISFENDSDDDSDDDSMIEFELTSNELTFIFTDTEGNTVFVDTLTFERQ